MTVVVLSRLVEENKLKLSDTLAKFIPDFPSGDKITIEMIRQHRSGILHRVMPPEMESVPYTSAEMVEKVRQSKLAFEPGTRRLYSSGGYAVLARVLEIASGKPYAQLLKEYVFDPAGMRDSLDFDGERIMERRAQDYLLEEGGYRNAALKDYSFLVGAGSVFSTAADTHRFGLAVVEGKYGENVKASQISDGRFSASGSTNGHRAYVEVKADKSYGYAVLSNLACGSVDMVRAGVREIMEGKEPTVTKLVVPKFDAAANPDLGQFVGKYRSVDGSEIEIVNRNGYLQSADIRMHSVKTDCFFDYKFFGEACFIREGGKIKALNWKGIGFDLTWSRQ
jgi:CubicO group peptidase (beta-lactamase class C family)